MFTSGDRASWLNAVAAMIMDGGANPPSVEYLHTFVPPNVVTRMNDGHVTAANKFGEKSRKDYKLGWRVIVDEMLVLLREQEFVGGTDHAVTWLKPVDGTWTVTMDDGRQLTVFGQRERRISRERAIVGERSEVDGSRVGPPSKFETGRMQPLELLVESARGKITEQRFAIHPLATLMPSYTEAEREGLRASIEREGVKVPIVIFEGKILDGRNRGYYASIFKKPVRLTEFTGTHAEARQLVITLNVNRRHLTTPQLALLAIKLYGDAASKQTAEAYKTNVGRPRKSALETAPISTRDRSNEWHETVARLANASGVNVTPASIRAMKEVIDVPEVVAQVESQDIKKVADANKKARKKKGLGESSTFEGVNHRSVTKHLGECIYHLNAILKDAEAPMGTMPHEISGRLQQIMRLSLEVTAVLRQRQVIK